MTAKWEGCRRLDVMMRPAEVFVRSLSHEEAVRLKRLSTRAKPGHADPRGDRGERLIPADPLPRRITLPFGAVRPADAAPDRSASRSPAPPCPSRTPPARLGGRRPTRAPSSADPLSPWSRRSGRHLASRTSASALVPGMELDSAGGTAALPPKQQRHRRRTRFKGRLQLVGSKRRWHLRVYASSHGRAVLSIETGRRIACADSASWCYDGGHAIGRQAVGERPRWVGRLGPSV